MPSRNYSVISTGKLTVYMLGKKYINNILFTAFLIYDPATTGGPDQLGEL